MKTSPERSIRSKKLLKGAIPDAGSETIGIPPVSVRVSYNAVQAVIWWLMIPVPPPPMLPPPPPPEFIGLTRPQIRAACVAWFNLDCPFGEVTVTV